MKTLYYLILSILFLSSCGKFDWNNPYDPECPKELFTPSSPGAAMEGNSVKLTWSQQNDDISGFALFRSAEGESITNLTQTQKSTTQYIDASITPGKKYTYYVVAVAGTNKSDTVKAEIIPVIPITITTGSVTELAATTAKVSGNITNAGGGTVTSRGICYSTTPNPTVNNSKTSEATGAGEFTSTLTNLLAGTTYYAKAYGENSRGMSYGSEITFTTLGPPKLTTTAVSNITATTATSGGTIISDGGSPITETGVCWSTITNPTIANSKTSNGPTKTSFVSNLLGLESSKSYYVRAYAINQFGVSYGEQFSFSTIAGPLFVNGSGVTDIDGNNYKTIIIGDKEWMAENLKVTRFLNGEPISLASSTADWNNLDLNRSPGYSAPGYSIQNLIPYGNMYNWYAVSSLKGVCPLGWRVPSASVWDSLINILGGQFLAGGKMKVVGFDYWLSPNLSATNESGFSAVGSGYNDPLGAFYAFKNNCFFWSNTEFSQNDAIYFWLYSDRAMIDKLNKPKNNGFNIRCVK